MFKHYSGIKLAERQKLETKAEIENFDMLNKCLRATSKSDNEINNFPKVLLFC